MLKAICEWPTMSPMKNVWKSVQGKYGLSSTRLEAKSIIFQSCRRVGYYLSFVFQGQVLRCGLINVKLRSVDLTSPMTRQGPGEYLM